MSNWMNKSETARYCRISRNTLNKWIVLGLPAAKIGGVTRLKREDVDAWMTAQADDINKLVEGL